MPGRILPGRVPSGKAYWGRRPGRILPGGGLNGGPAAVPRTHTPLRSPQGRSPDEGGGLGE